MYDVFPCHSGKMVSAHWLAYTDLTTLTPVKSSWRGLPTQ